MRVLLAAVVLLVVAVVAHDYLALRQDTEALAAEYRTAILRACASPTDKASAA